MEGCSKSKAGTLCYAEKTWRLGSNLGAWGVMRRRAGLGTSTPAPSPPPRPHRVCPAGNSRFVPGFPLVPVSSRGFPLRGPRDLGPGPRGNRPLICCPLPPRGRTGARGVPPPPPLAPLPCARTHRIGSPRGNTNQCNKPHPKQGLTLHVLQRRVATPLVLVYFRLF